MSGTVAAGTVKAGFYCVKEVTDQARAAYLADLDATPAGPEFFVDWFRAALESYAARTPAERAELAAGLPQVESSRGYNTMYPLPAELLEQITGAIREDRQQAGRPSSRSSFAREALLVAVSEARQRHGGRLPTPPNNLRDRQPRRLS